MPFSLSLPPLVVLLLLAFLWLVLLVLLLWFAFRPRRRPDELEKVVKPRPKASRDGLEATPKAIPPRARSPQPSPPRTSVRAVSPGTPNPKPDPETDPHDDFDDFNRPGNRRDDFDF